MKICSKCGIDKPTHEYYKNDRYCKECRREVNKARNEELHTSKELIKLLKVMNYDYYLELLEVYNRHLRR